jgi:uncharacterized protein (UPF0210 family)
MKIRSITCFYQPEPHGGDELVVKLGGLAGDVRRAFTGAGYEVQTTRLASTPFPTYLPMGKPDECITTVQHMETFALGQGFAYLSIGPALAKVMDSYNLIPQLANETQNTFMGGDLLADATTIHLGAVKACARIITRLAGMSVDGFTNCRFAAMANVAPLTPFFPAAYHVGGQPAFSIAVECADVILEAFSGGDTLAECRGCLLERLESHARVLGRLSEDLAQKHGVRFAGFDFSTAPFPEDWCSVGAAFEKLGIGTVGNSGSLAAAAFLADTLDQGRWPRAGYNGLMPVLEDSVLALRSSTGSLTVKDLLLYSAVCGTGLDTLPLPGDATPAQISAVLVDIAALATRLHKPLTARLMPIPGKKAGDPTGFSFAFFANGKVMDLPTAGLTGLLGGDERVSISPRGK